METNLERILTGFNKSAMIAYLEANPGDFDKAVQLAMEDKQPWSWRAAWVLWSCMQKNDPRIRAYTKAMIDSLQKKRDGHQRELLKILYEMEIGEEQEGYLFDQCVGIWEKIHKQPSVRYNAFRLIVRIAGKYPDLFNEIIFLTEDQFTETLSPGVRRGIQKMIDSISPLRSAFQT